MFDFTREIALGARDYSIYRRFQLAVYLIAIILAVYLSYLVIFPSAPFTFSFLNPTSSKNSVITPRDISNNSLVSGKVAAGQKLIFDNALVGNYSKIQVDLTLGSKTSLPSQASLAVQKSYPAFLYPQGNPIGFKDGTLIKNNNDYYLVSDGKLRKFAGDSILSSLGWKSENFILVDSEDLKYNDLGDSISDIFSYPDDAIFQINGDYYILINQQLAKFSSTKAFLSQYDTSQAIAKDQDFIKNYTVAADPIGYADGTLISSGISAFIVSSGKILPINEVSTFAADGYNWNDVIPASADEIALYQRDKLFTLSSPHPDGTIMLTADDGKYYMIKDGQKHLLPSAVIAKSWLKEHPVIVSSKSLQIQESCQLKNNFWNSHVYSCVIPLESFQNLIGSNYEFSFSDPESLKIDSISTTFKKSVSWTSFRATLSQLISRVRSNYVPQTATTQ